VTESPENAWLKDFIERKRNSWRSFDLCFFLGKDFASERKSHDETCVTDFRSVRSPQRSGSILDR